jgi:small-conductance mechanosensitive channel
MSHIIKDFLTGSAILVAGILLSFAAFIILLILWIFLNILGAFVWVFFIVFLFLAAVWLIGYIYRNIKGQ